MTDAAAGTGDRVERMGAGAARALGPSLIGRDTPVVISGGVDGQTRGRCWSPAALRSAAGDRIVLVSKSDDEAFDFTDEGEPRHSAVSLPLAEALSLIEGSGPPGPYYYVRRARLADLGLEAEGLPGASIERGTKKAVNLWLGAAGCVTPLHYDAKSNLLTQLRGTKRVTLFPPSDHRLMYPYDMRPHIVRGKTFLYSRVNPEAVDEKRFPGFPSAARHTVRLRPGETLLIPPFWWHHVRSLGLSISASVTWRVRPEDCLVPAAVDYLRVKYRLEKLQEFFQDEGERGPLRFARLAADAHARGLECAAALFCGAATHLALRVLAGGAGPGGAASPAAAEGGAEDAAEALAARGVIGERACRQAQLWLLLADFAASHGKAPKSSELESMLAGVADFAARHPRWTNARGSASIQE